MGRKSIDGTVHGIALPFPLMHICGIQLRVHMMTTSDTIGDERKIT